MLAPAALAIVTTTFTDPAERGKAFGVFGAIAGSGAAVGLLLGGVLTEVLDWRWTMYVNLAFAIPAAMAGPRLLVNCGPPSARASTCRGTLVATSGLFSLVYGFSNAETDGWGAPLTIAMLAFGVVLLAGFVLSSAARRNPLLPLRVVADRDRGAPTSRSASGDPRCSRSFLFLTYYLQQNLGFSPIESGSRSCRWWP